MRKSRLKALVDRCLSQRQMAEKLGCSQSNVRYWLRRYKLKTAKMGKSPRRMQVSEARLRECVEASACMAECLRKLGFSVSSPNYESVKRRLNEFEIGTEHWTRNGGKGLRRRPLKELLIRNSSAQSAYLKRRLVEEDVLVDGCANCGLGPEWNDEPLSLVLDHINGVRSDNRLKNLRILCPNCHSQTPTFAGRNKRSRGQIQVLQVRVLSPLKSECLVGVHL